MIIAEIVEGLGNQMFQYAAARRAAHVHQTILKLDISGYRANKYRRFGLNHFNFNPQIASWLDIARICPFEALQRAINCLMPRRVSRRIIGILNKVGLQSPYRPRTAGYAADQPLPKLLVGGVASERFFHFDPELLSCPDNICLSGFWQSEKYFNEVSDIIREELAINEPLNGANELFAQRLAAGNSISLHIRRGDKAMNSHFNATIGGYCFCAMQLFRAKVTNPCFYVFSDDWQWVRENIPASNQVIYVDHNTAATDYEDLRLMSLCKHNIVAPSSFSWWAAWLNRNSEKIVIRPRAFTKMANHDSKDVFPPSWIAID